MAGIIEKEKGASVIYTPFPEGREFKGWLLATGVQLREARRIIESEGYEYGSAFVEYKRYLLNGNAIDLINRYWRIAPKLKEGWVLKIHSEKRENLEEIVKKLGLPLN